MLNKKGLQQRCNYLLAPGSTGCIPVYHNAVIIFNVSLPAQVPGCMWHLLSPGEAAPGF